MNRLTKFLLVAALVAVPAVAHAQNESAEAPRRQDEMTIEHRARMITDRMDRLLTLTEKQYQKIYELNLKELREMEADSLFMGRRRPGFGPGFGPGPGGAGAPGSRAQFERDMARSNSQFNQLTQQQMEELRAAHEKTRLKKEKKLKKILTEEQYGKWVMAEQERLVKMQQMRKGRGQRRAYGGPQGSRPDSSDTPHHHHHHLPDSAALPQAPEQPAE